MVDLILLVLGKKKKKAVLARLSVMLHRVNFSKGERRRGIQIGRNNLEKNVRKYCELFRKSFSYVACHSSNREEMGLATSPF